ncbi:putative immunity protein [Enterococcus sp. AZ109]|uniref:putative immunity protein n=1 Tax=Enterococcus sp. AZ109 TaxID=2774634 RepID=UPI003F685D65
MAQESSSELSKYAARIFAQAVATDHMRGHALVSADYGIKVINLLFPMDLLQVTQQREMQLASARHFLAHKK